MSDAVSRASTFQELIFRLQRFWSDRGCILAQPYDIEKGAGTYNPHTFLRALGPEPWRVAYVEPSRRPTDGRYGDNPNRLYRHHQFQVILKPSPKDVQGLYLDSMAALGIHPLDHDIRFVEDNWESPTLGAWGLGWEVWVDGMELTQFTYFQQCGGLECRPVSAELTYGLERIAMYLQGVDNVYDLSYAPGIRYREVFHEDEVEFSRFTFESLDVKAYLGLYEACEKECARLVELNLVIPAYDHLLKAAHAFNALDASGAISVTERQAYILRIRDLAKACAEAYVALRESLGFPLLQAESERPQKAEPSGGSERPGTRGELFVEVGTEELPAKEVWSALCQLRDGVSSRLQKLSLSHDAPKIYATPRRLAVAFSGLPQKQDDVTKEVLGPPVQAAFRDGAPTKAALGFAKGQGQPVEDLFRKHTERGEYVALTVTEKGEPTAKLLPDVVEAAIGSIAFSRSMRWGSQDESFSRPIQWLVALYEGAVLPVQFAGVSAGGESRGHRFHAPDAFWVEGQEAYVSELKKRSVMADIEGRRAMLVEGANALAEKRGAQLYEDEDLMDELVQLVEWPHPLLSEFDPRFLEIPREVLISEMIHHQRYIPVVDENGALLPCFVVVANTKVVDQDLSLQGYRRVLTARFEDGAFFFKEDQKTPLYQRVDGLKNVRFHRALGSVYDKVARNAGLSFWMVSALGAELGIHEVASRFVSSAEARALADGSEPGDTKLRFCWRLARACFLAKADLGTLMVYEFPDLQGVMGAYYARLSQEPEDVAQAVREHYQPKGAHDTLPQGVLGALVGLADRLDSIVGVFSVGKGPTGTADPFGLRRAAMGVIRVLRDRAWHLSLSGALDQAGKALVSRAKKDGTKVKTEVLEFFRARIKGLMGADGIPADVAEAVLAAGFDDVVDAFARAEALAQLEESPDFEPVLVTFKRVANILKNQTPSSLDPLRFRAPEEKQLHAALAKVQGEVELAARGRDFASAFSHLAALRPAVDAFFENVMVMDEDLDVRAARVALLASVHAVFSPLADLTRLS